MLCRLVLASSAFLLLKSKNTLVRGSPLIPQLHTERNNKMKIIIISILSFLFGGFAGITTMCLVQINRTNGNERFEKEDSSDEQDN